MHKIAPFLFAVLFAMAFIALSAGLSPSHAAGKKASAHSASSNAAGIWRTSDGKARVKISQCGKSLCNRIIWLRNSKDADGTSKKDSNNKNPRLRKRKLLGTRILLSMRANGPGKWIGRIYDPKRGQIFSAVVKVQGPKTLMVKGCLLGSSLCKHHIWQRVGRSPTRTVRSHKYVTTSR